MTDDPTVETVALTKRYGETPVLAGLDLSIPAGSVHALLGPNGASKTTTVRVLATLTAPDGGTARVAGFDVVTQRTRVRAAISLTGQYAALDGAQTGSENLRMIARLAGLSRAGARRRAGELLERLDLVAAGERRVATCSGGMRRRLDLAASLIRPPQVLFLDEPTTGLDPRSRQEVWASVGELTAAGATVLLTTQYLEEADRLADRIAVLDRGAIIAQGTADELKATVGGQRLDLTAVGAAAFATLRKRLGERALALDADAGRLGVATDGSAEDVRAQLDELDPERVLVARFAVHAASLDDVFMSLTETREVVHV